jgi:hypothetical protein
MLDRQRLKTFLIGGAAGVLAGVLFAPRSGREIRNSLSNRAGEARERSRERYFDAQERLQERLADLGEGRRSHPRRETVVGPSAGEGTEEPSAGPSAEPLAERPKDAGSGPESPFAPEPEGFPLRDVSAEGPGERPRDAPGGEPAQRSEELRRRIRQTRERIRARSGEISQERSPEPGSGDRQEERRED